MPERNIVQAMFPEGSRVIPNPHGSAPGIDLEVPRDTNGSARVFALPGVPAEMREMWGQTVAPAIAAMLGSSRRVIRSRTIRCFGVGESDLEAMLPDLIRRGRQPTVGITVSQATISLRIVAEGSSDVECEQQIETTQVTIRECLGNLVFGEGEEELAHAIVRLAAARAFTVATGESGSGGLLANSLSEADESGQYYRGGLVRRGGSCGTPELTAQLAEDARSALGADYGLALSDFPASDGQGSVPGDIHIAYAGVNGVASVSVPFAGHPEILKPRAVKQTLNFLRLAWLSERTN
jgi:nicotinamide-nucleotide amidase